MIGRLVIDSSAIVTDMCILGHQENTDKSPFNQHGHRHPYTPVYSMLFSPLKNKPIQFAEIGVAMGASAALWCRYFTHPDTKIVVFDRDMDLLKHTVERVPDTRLRTGAMDVEVDGSVSEGLGKDTLYDVILDDSSHNLEHQIRIIREAMPCLKPGGMLIIEDVFRNQDEKGYTERLKEELGMCSFAYFVVCEHAARWSPGWDNDKLFVLVKA